MKHQFIGFSIIGIFVFLFLFAPNLVFATCHDEYAVPAGGDYTVQTSCTFGGTINGVDNGNLIIAADQTLTISADQTIVWNLGKSITINSNAEIAISVGATGLKKTNLWMEDGDSDGYPLNTDQTAQDGDPGGNFRRRNVLTSHTAVDANDENGDCYRNRYLIAGAITNCVPAAAVCVADEVEYQDTPVYFTVFVSSSTRQGNFSTPTVADDECDALASVSNKYTAWVSEGTSDEPQDRGLSDCPGAGGGSAAWYLVGGSIRVANDWDDLIDGTIDAAINLDEGGSPQATHVWTGTNSDGVADAKNCNGWTSAASNKKSPSGDPTAINSTWTDNVSNSSCDNPFRLYCFQHAQ